MTRQRGANMSLGHYILFGSLSLFMGYSAVNTVSEVLPIAVDPRPLREVSVHQLDLPVQGLSATVEMHTDGWTKYTTNVLYYDRPLDARWTVVIVAPDGKRVCAGYGDSQYNESNEGSKVWTSDYFTGDDCPEMIPFGSRGTVTYTPRDPHFLPYILDFVVTATREGREDYDLIEG